MKNLRHKDPPPQASSPAPQSFLKSERILGLMKRVSTKRQTDRSLRRERDSGARGANNPGFAAQKRDRQKSRMHLADSLRGPSLFYISVSDTKLSETAKCRCIKRSVSFTMVN